MTNVFCSPSAVKFNEVGETVTGETPSGFPACVMIICPPFTKNDVSRGATRGFFPTVSVIVSLPSPEVGEILTHESPPRLFHG